MERNIPRGIKAIVIYFYIISILFLILAFYPTSFIGMINQFYLQSIFFLIVAVFLFFIARGLWKFQKWARIAIIIFSIITLIYSLIKFSFVGIIIHTFIVVYLIFNKQVKKLFS
jgi:hypothetical protein